MLQNLINIIASPQATFNSLKEKRTALVPVLILMLFTGVMQFLYYSNVDPDFLIEQLMEQLSGIAQLVPGSEDEIRRSLEEANPADSGISTAIQSSLSTPLIIAAYAAYLALASKFTSDNIGFKRWFSLVAWTSIPGIFSSLAAIVVILSSSDGLIATSQLSPFSLNNLIFQTSGSFSSILNIIDLTQIWGAALLVLGYQNWTEKSLLKSSIISLLPFILIYGIWTLIIIL